MKHIVTSLSTLFIVIACFAQKTNRPVPKPVPRAVNKPTGVQSAVTKYFPNDITMKIKGFKVVETGLYFEDGTKVPIGNIINLNQKVLLYVVVDSGYNVVDGKVFPGSSERIALSNGQEVLKNDDLFAAYNDGVSVEDGRYLTLKAVITKLDNKDLGITVSFKIWDKKGPNTITGSYKLHIKKDE